MKKRILILTSRYPFPVVGGDRLRIYYLSKYLSNSFDITLLSLCGKKEYRYENKNEFNPFIKE